MGLSSHKHSFRCLDDTTVVCEEFASSLENARRDFCGGMGPFFKLYF